MAELTELTDTGGRRRTNSRSKVGLITLMVGLVAVTALAVSGCTAQVVETGVSSSTGSTEEQIAVADTEPTGDAVWLAKGTRIALLTYGSTSCPPEFEVDADEDSDTEYSNFGLLTVSEIPAKSGQVCTADIGPRISLIDVPREITSQQQNLKLVVSSESSEVAYDLPWLNLGERVTDDRPAPATTASFFPDGKHIVALVQDDDGCSASTTSGTVSGPQQITAMIALDSASQCGDRPVETPVLITVPDGIDTADVAKLILVGGGTEEHIAVPAARSIHPLELDQIAMDLDGVEPEAFWYNRKMIEVVLPIGNCGPFLPWSVAKAEAQNVTIPLIPTIGGDCTPDSKPYVFMRPVEGLNPDATSNTVTLESLNSEIVIPLPAYRESAEPPANTPVSARWIQDGAAIVVEARGGSLCSSGVESVTTESSTSLAIVLEQPGWRFGCVPTTHTWVFATGNGVSRTDEITATISLGQSVSTVTLPPLE